jgi:DNA repair exonuclease SbcCD nuclease subunit
MEEQTAKILVIGDMHFSKRSAMIIKPMTEGILASIRKYKPDHVVFLGDTLDRFRNVDAVRQTEAVNFFYQCSLLCPFTVLIGNHDIETKTLFMSPEHGFVAMRYYWPVNIVDTKCIEFLVKGLRFQAVPYCPNGMLEEGLATIENKTGEPVATFCHQEIEGCDTGRRILTGGGDSWSYDKGLLVAGHIHLHKKMKDEEGRVYALYIGSPYQDNIDECPDKSISLLTFIGTTWTEKRIYLGLPTKVSLAMTYKEYRKWEPEDNTIYFLSICGSASDLSRVSLMDKTKTIKANGGKITTINTSTTDKSTSVRTNTGIHKSITLKEAVGSKIKDKPHLADIYAEVFGS